MGLALTTARHSLWKRPGRTLFSVLGIAVGIGTVVGVFTLDHNTVAGLRLRHAAPTWQPDLDVRAVADMPDALGTLEGTDGIARAAAYFQNEVTVAALSRDGDRDGSNDTGAALNATLLAADARAVLDLDAYSLAAGSDLDPQAADPQVLLGSKLADALGVELGDAVLLSPARPKTRKECIDGRYVEAADDGVEGAPGLAFELVGILASEKLGRRSGGAIGLIDYGWGRELFRSTRVDERFWVSRDPAVDVERLQSGLAQNFAFDIERSVLIGQTAEERAFRNGVRMAGLLALVLGLYVIFHTLSMSLVERVKEVATLHALGTTRGQVARIFFVEAVALSGLGGLGGLVGGIALARLLLALGITTLGSGRHQSFFEVPWGIAIALTSMGVGVALLGSVFPLLRAKSTNTVAVLRGEMQSQRTSGGHVGFHLFAAVLLAGLLPALYFVVAPVLGETSGELVGVILLGVGLLGLFVAIPFLVPSLISAVAVAVGTPFRRWWPFSGSMAVQSMRESRRRVAVATSAIALVVASFVGLKSMTQSLHAEVEEWSEAALADKLFVSGLPKRALDDVHNAVAGLPELQGIEAKSARIHDPFLILGLDTEQLTEYGPIARNPELLETMRRRHGMILSERLAMNLGYEVEDEIKVAHSSRGEVQSFRAVAVSDEYGYFPDPDERMYAVVHDDYLRQYFCMGTNSPDRLALRLEPGSDSAAVRAALTAAFPESELAFREGHEIRDLHTRDIDRDFFLFDVILSLTAVLAMLGILNGQLLSALERSKELGILKALGATRGQMAGMIWLESLVIGVVGGLLGLALGAGLGPVIVRALETIASMQLPYRGPEMWGVLAPAAAALLSLVAGIYPAWMTNRMDAVKAVRTG